LIEDDARVREMMAKSLQMRGFEVVEVGTLKAALDLLASGFSPWVSVLDLNLPNGAGLDVVRALIAASLAGRWPIVIVTGEYDDRWAKEAYDINARVQQYVLKSRLNYFRDDDSKSANGGVSLAKFCYDAISRYKTIQREKQAEQAEAVKRSVPSDLAEKAAHKMGVYGLSRRRLQWIIGLFASGLVGLGAAVSKMSEWPSDWPSPALVGAAVCAFAVSISLYAIRARR
jgi:CheY-like chemotaxis protein